MVALAPAASVGSDAGLRGPGGATVNEAAAASAAIAAADDQDVVTEWHAIKPTVAIKPIRFIMMSPSTWR